MPKTERSFGNGFGLGCGLMLGIVAALGCLSSLVCAGVFGLIGIGAAGRSANETFGTAPVARPVQAKQPTSPPVQGR